MTRRGTDRPLTQRLESLETRVRRLERPSSVVPGVRTRSSDPGWILEGLKARCTKRGRGRVGLVGYAGIVQPAAAARYQWRGEHDVAELLAMDWQEMAKAFAALGHRVRLDLLRALIRGVSDVSQLRKQLPRGTTGQLYHHLRELQAAGWVRQQERSRYMVVPDRVVAALLMIGIARGPELRPESPRRRRTKR